MTLLPLLMLFAFTMMDNNIGSRIGSSDRITDHITVCIYKYSNINVLVHRLIEELSKYYDNLTIILFANFLDFENDALLHKCDVVLGVDNIVVVVLKYSGILKPLTPTLYYSYRIPSRADNVFASSYGIPYCYHELVLSNNVTKSIEDYIYLYINGETDISNLRARGLEGSENSIILYEMMVILNLRRGVSKLVNILLSNTTQNLLERQATCKSIYKVPHRRVQRINTLELMYLLRKISYNLKEHLLSKDTLMGVK